MNLDHELLVAFVEAFDAYRDADAAYSYENAKIWRNDEIRVPLYEAMRKAEERLMAFRDAIGKLKDEEEHRGSEDPQQPPKG